MTEGGVRTGTDRALQGPREGGLRVRLWIGRNPLVFVAVCLLAGYGLGRKT